MFLGWQGDANCNFVNGVDAMNRFTTIAVSCDEIKTRRNFPEQHPVPNSHPSIHQLTAISLSPWFPHLGHSLISLIRR